MSSAEVAARAPYRRGTIGRIAPVMIWPVLVSGSAGACLALLQAGVDPAASAMIPILIAALAVLALEHGLPYRREWSPSRSEMRADFLFMLAVQLAWPRVLGVAVALALVAPLGRTVPGLSGVWPGGWPFAAQALLLLLASDLLRYWLHRAAHAWPLLWRLHAVHHSPDRLYWLNVGRFHPVEKTLQMCVETFPFALLGAGEPVIALLFVLSAANGFLKHSNIELRHGALNYIVSNAEHHRWHHSRQPEESNRNYGENLIVWDLLFGSWFLPEDRAVGDLGLRDRGYPAGFLAQMVVPFAPAAVRLWRRLVSGALGALVRRRELSPALDAARQPRAEQERTLARILHRNRETVYGRAHGFAAITSVEDFTRRVPIVEYESLRAHIEAQAATAEQTLTRAAPDAYVLTSGTTARPKLLPLVAESLAELRAAQRLQFALLQQWIPKAFHGRTLALVGPVVEQRLVRGQPAGSMSGLLYASLPRLLRRGFVVPPEIFEIADHELKYRLVLRLALAERELSHVAAPNPSTLLRLLEILDTERDEFAAELEQGGFARLAQLGDRARKVVERRLRADPARAADLRDLGPGPLNFGTLWPGLALVSTWTGGSCGIALNSLKARLPSHARIVDLGYAASECRGTITLDPGIGAGLPMLRHTFFEFAEVAGWDRGGRRTLTLDRLKAGAEYYVIVTTSSGLYRYFMNDIVRVEGFRFGTPLLKFVQKGRGVTSLTGEKLYESQAIESMIAVRRRFALDCPFYVLLADPVRAGYACYLEAGAGCGNSPAEIADALDRELADRNIEYRDKRASGRLKAPLVLPVARGTGNAYRNALIARGQRESQCKPAVLAYAGDCRFDFSRRVVKPSCV